MSNRTSEKLYNPRPSAQLLIPRPKDVIDIIIFSGLVANGGQMFTFFTAG